MTDRELMQMALNAGIPDSVIFIWDKKLISFANMVIATKQHQSVNPKSEYEVTHNKDNTFSVALPDGDELRIVPPKKEWVGLTDEKSIFQEGLKQLEGTRAYCFLLGAKWAEAKLKEKNT